jgi:hypothetical protein
MHASIKRHESALFGYWDDGTRVKGVLEHQDDMMASILMRDKALDDIKENFIKVAWQIGKPVIAMLALLVIVGAIALLASGYAVLHPDIVQKVIGH